MSAVWTGRELITWGGASEYGDVVHADGAAYDPATEKWSVLPTSPLRPRADAAAVWTGNEMLLWGGWSGSAQIDADGAAFDPDTRAWRKLPAAPLDGPRQPVAAVWTGRELIVWGDVGRFGEVVDGAAYDPEADRWRMLSPAPVALNEASAVWTGEEMIVLGALLDGNNWSKTEHAEGIAYDPKTNEWRRIAPYPFSPQASWAAWTGEEVVVWDYELTAAAYDSVEDVWRELPDLPLDFSECYPRSVALLRVVFAYHCGGPTALFDVRAGTWTVVPLPASHQVGAPVLAGEVVVFEIPKELPTKAMWVYKP